MGLVCSDEEEIRGGAALVKSIKKLSDIEKGDN